jgi:hypothetical protein
MHRACTDNRTHTDNRTGTDHQAEQSFLSPYHIVRILKDYFGGVDNLGSQSLHLEGEKVRKLLSFVLTAVLTNNYIQGMVGTY